MATEQGRFPTILESCVAEGWRLERLTAPSRLYGANGIRTGPDGRIYVAQVSGSQISAVHPDSGVVEAVSPMGGDIVAPDDLDFDDSLNLYATEITKGRVSVLTPTGETRVVYGDLPCANPITVYRGRLFAGECRPNGRIMELDLNGGAPRVLLDNVPMPNAMEVGPDGLLYFPVMGTNEIWRISLDGGAPEVVARDLGVPDAVKFDSNGFIVSTQVASGQVLRIDPATGAQQVLATIAPGLDNLTFVGQRLFVSSISGQINEILGDGRLRPLVPDGLQWPLGLAMGEDGVLFVADGAFTYTLQPGGEPRVAGMLFSPGFPGYTRGVVPGAAGEYIVTTANGDLARWHPAQQSSESLASGFDQLYGLAVSAGGAVLFAEQGRGRLLALDGGRVRTLLDELQAPTGVALHGDDCLVAEQGAGRIVKAGARGAETVVDGLSAPQGIHVRGDQLYIVDAGARSLIAIDLAGGERVTLATDLPVGPPPGVIPKFIGAIGDMSGPMGPFADVTSGLDGTLYISADADGSVLALHPPGKFS